MDLSGNVTFSLRGLLNVRICINSVLVGWLSTGW